MKNERTHYRVTIFGEHYSLISDESTELLNQITALVDSLMKEIATKSRETDHKKIAVLVALQLASRLIDGEHEKKSIARKEAYLINKIEQALSIGAP